MCPCCAGRCTEQSTVYRGERSCCIFSFHPPQRCWYNRTIIWDNWDNSIHRFYPWFLPKFKLFFLPDLLYKLEIQCYWGVCLPYPFAEVLQILPIMLVQKQSKGKEKSRNLNGPVLDDLPLVRSFPDSGVQLKLGWSLGLCRLPWGEFL